MGAPEQPAVKRLHTRPRVYAAVVPNNPVPLREVVGAAFKARREALGLRQDEVRAAARGLGLAWSRSLIASLERGEKAVGVEEFLLLPELLHIAWKGRGGELTSLADLVPDDADVSLTGAVHASGAAIKARLSGIRPPKEDDLQMDVPTEVDAEAIDQRRGELLDLFGDGLTLTQVSRAAQAQSDADRLVARRIGEKPLVVAVSAQRLWDHSLVTERDRRVAEEEESADPARLRALRGRTTRHLGAELRGYLEAVRRERQET
jgi:transcriptional regulator with XRE-family HTH domain